MERKEFLTRFDNKEKFSERELRDILWDLEGAEEVDEIEGDQSRWNQGIETILKLDDRYFSLYWNRGLTECQENEFWWQPTEVTKKQYEKTITVTEWVPIEKSELEK